MTEHVADDLFSDRGKNDKNAYFSRSIGWWCFTAL